MSFVFPPVPFYFLRHGVTDHNLRRLVMGQLDIPLNPQGRRQAEAAAGLVASLGVVSIVCSPLSRARETAEIVALRLGLAVTLVDALRERDWGEMSGRSYRDMFRQLQPAGAETTEAFAERVLAAATALTAPQPALMVAHSGVCRVLRRHFALPNVEGPVPNAIPLLFLPSAEGRWSETVVDAQAIDT